MPGAQPRSSFHHLITTSLGRGGSLHFTGEESKAQAGKVACPRSHSRQVAESGFSSSFTGCEAYTLDCPPLPATDWSLGLAINWLYDLQQVSLFSALLHPEILVELSGGLGLVGG